VSLLALLGLAPLTVAVGATTLRALVRLLTMAGGSFPLAGLVFFGATSALVYLLLRRFAARTATIGVDGVTIEQLIGRRFVPYAQIAAIDEDDKGVVLTTHDGERVPLRVSFGKIAPFASDGSTERRAAILDRIRQARARAGEGKLGEAKLARLDRGERSVADWSNALARTRAAGYRVESFEADELVRIACDPEVLPERRVGATLALRGQAESEVARVRVAAAACVDEDLRRALEAAAEGEVAEAELARVTERMRR
jgi:membrane protein implicated in regulation of membrane protease activity